MVLSLLSKVALSFVAVPQIEPPEWLYVSPGILQGISGIAYQSGSGDTLTFIVVHDDKDDSMPDEPRAGLLTVAKGKWPTYRRLSWIGDQATPKDLEAISSIPGDPRYVASTSKGQAFLLNLDLPNRAIRVESSFSLAPDNAEIEGLSVAMVGGRRLLVWGDRGKEGKGTLWWARLDESMKIGSPSAGIELKSPWPEMTRAVGDLKLMPDGMVYAIAAEDKGNFGPFASGLYVAGKLTPNGDGYTFVADGAAQFRTGGHKIEGFEFVNGKVIFGTDDESFGSSVWFDFWPTP